VKLIGATAHLVTSDLDEGPLIAQDVVRVTHAHSPAQMVALGAEVEERVLASAVQWTAERRVILNGTKVR
jgi:formyltetrahydrofolate deformylase